MHIYLTLKQIATKNHPFCPCHDIQHLDFQIYLYGYLLGALHHPPLLQIIAYNCMIMKQRTECIYTTKIPLQFVEIYSLKITVPTFIGWQQLSGMCILCNAMNEGDIVCRTHSILESPKILECMLITKKNLSFATMKQEIGYENGLQILFKLHFSN